MQRITHVLGTFYIALDMDFSCVRCYVINELVFFVFEGSLVLVGGDPGVGKSTLLLQVVINCNV